MCHSEYVLKTPCFFVKTWSIVTISGLLLSLCLGMPAFAQSRSHESWKRIEEADNRIYACEIKWKRIHTVKPQAGIDPQKVEEVAAEQLRQQGLDEASVKTFAAESRKSSEMTAKGYTQTVDISVERHGNSVWAALEVQSPVYSGSPPPSTSRIINYYDGKNAISLDTRKQGEETPTIGSLSREKDSILRDAANGPTLSSLLTGLPITTAFPPSSTSLQEGPNNSVILTQAVFETIPLQRQVAISKQTWRPVTIDTTSKKERLSHFGTSGYKQFNGGIWLPGKITFSRFNSAGATTDVTEFILIDAKFNEATTLTGLSHPLSGGMQIADRRFGEPSVTYELESSGELPTDKKVQELVEQRKADLRAQKANSKAAMTTPSVLVVGMLLLTSGAFLWSRSKRTDVV